MAMILIQLCGHNSKIFSDGPLKDICVLLLTNDVFVLEDSVRYVVTTLKHKVGRDAWVQEVV